MMRKMRDQLILLSLCILIALYGKTHGEIQTFNNQPNLHLSDYNTGWMKDLPDDKLLSAITLPGTHDTVALHGGPAVECQAWTLEDQLKAGIRYLDLRVVGFSKLYLMHGIVYQFLTFREALDTIMEFLRNNKQETVLVRVKPELFFEDKVQQLVENEIKITSVADMVWVHNEMPTLGKVRGKVVLVQKKEFKLGITLMQENTEGDYKVTNIEKKKSVTETNLDKARSDCGKSVVLTCSSGTGFGTLKGMFITPKKVAEELNPWLYNYLQEHYDKKTPCFGIIAMDFPGIDLIQKIISFNYQ